MLDDLIQVNFLFIKKNKTRIMFESISTLETINRWVKGVDIKSHIYYLVYDLIHYAGSYVSHTINE